MILSQDLQGVKNGDTVETILRETRAESERTPLFFREISGGLL